MHDGTDSSNSIVNISNYLMLHLYMRFDWNDFVEFRKTLGKKLKIYFSQIDFYFVKYKNILINYTDQGQS